MRTFVAIDLPDDLRSQLAGLQSQLGTGRRVAAGNLHMTLVFLGEAGPQRLQDLHAELAGMTAQHVDIEVSGLDLYGALPRPRLVAARVAETEPLKNLQSHVARAARRAGFDLERRRFRPHVTLARFGGGAPADPVLLDRFLAAFAGISMPAMPARTMALYESRLRPEGAEYEKLAEYPI